MERKKWGRVVVGFYLHNNSTGTEAIGHLDHFFGNGLVVMLRHVDEMLRTAIPDQFFFGAGVDPDDSHCHAAAC